MIATHTTELLDTIRKGVLDPVVTAWLDEAPADQLVGDLRPTPYRFTFQERRIGKKWEISLARSFRAELSLRPIPEAVFASVLLVPAYLNCLMISAEENRVTGISRISRLTVRGVTDPETGLALKSGHGFKLDKTPDGWEIKAIKPRLVKLSAEFLRKRGWQLDHLKQLIPVQ
jgi:hypothetical protein